MTTEAERLADFLDNFVRVGGASLDGALIQVATQLAIALAVIAAQGVK